MEAKKSIRLNNENVDSSEVVELSTLSKMTGFPVDFIKSEILVDQEKISLDQLRASMVTYLESTNELFQG